MNNEPSSYFKVEKSGKDIILTPNEGYDSVIVWMHGLGDSALGFLDVFIPDNRPIPKKMKVILLTAPNAPVTINGGMSSTSWFDILHMTKFSVNEDEANRNALRIKKVINNEAKNLNNDYSKIFIGGFSQGACMSFLVSLTLPSKLGGVIALSGFLFPNIELTEDKSDIAIFAYHGQADMVIFESLSSESYKRLKDAKFSNFYYKTEKNMAHEVSFNELKEMKEFIEKNLKLSNKESREEF